MSLHSSALALGRCWAYHRHQQSGAQTFGPGALRQSAASGALRRSTLTLSRPWHSAAPMLGTLARSTQHSAIYGAQPLQRSRGVGCILGQVSAVDNSVTWLLWRSELSSALWHSDPPALGHSASSVEGVWSAAAPPVCSSAWLLAWPGPRCLSAPMLGLVGSWSQLVVLALAKSIWCCSRPLVCSAYWLLEFSAALALSRSGSGFGPRCFWCSSWPILGHRGGQLLSSVVCHQSIALTPGLRCSFFFFSDS
jgi:hypothetical protein